MLSEHQRPRRQETSLKGNLHFTQNTGRACTHVCMRFLYAPHEWPVVPATHRFAHKREGIIF